jgi:hypothetical protein
MLNDLFKFMGEINNESDAEQANVLVSMFIKHSAITGFVKGTEVEEAVRDLIIDNAKFKIRVLKLQRELGGIDEEDAVTVEELDDESLIDIEWERKQEIFEDSILDDEDTNMEDMNAAYFDEIEHDDAEAYDDTPKESTLNADEKIAFCRKYDPEMPRVECIEAYNTYWGYRSEGQSQIVSLQYAGLYFGEDHEF